MTAWFLLVGAVQLGSDWHREIMTGGSSGSLLRRAGLLQAQLWHEPREIAFLSSFVDGWTSPQQTADRFVHVHWPALSQLWDAFHESGRLHIPAAIAAKCGAVDEPSLDACIGRDEPARYGAELLVRALSNAMDFAVASDLVCLAESECFGRTIMNHEWREMRARMREDGSGWRSSAT